MEVFGVAANVMAAVSLALQFIDTIEILKEFWKGMKNAPEEVQHILRDLDLLRGILEGLGRALREKSHHDFDADAVSSVLAALSQCQNHMNEMAVYARGFQRGFSKKHHLTSFKVVLQKPKISEFSRHLEQAKSTLLLAINVTTFIVQDSCYRNVLRQFSELRSDLVLSFSEDSSTTSSKTLYERVFFSEESTESASPTVYDQVSCSGASANETPRIIRQTDRRICGSEVLLWLLQLPPNSPYRQQLQKMGRLIGCMAWRSSKKLTRTPSGVDSLKESMFISIDLPLVSRKYTFYSSRALGQWTHIFRTIRIIPDDSPVFRWCATDDELVLRRLFESGAASPLDQTVSGITLLHVAAANYQFKTFNLLKDCGVEYSFCDGEGSDKLSPICMTQHSRIYVNNKYQTVQEWLSINNSDSQLLHPERNYAGALEIWNSSDDIRDSASDEDVMTILQGPLLLPRSSGSPNASFHGKTDGIFPPRYCRKLLLFCYYFIYCKDPYDFGVSRATIHSPYLDSSVPFYSYIGQYWKRSEWMGMLPYFIHLDFKGVAQRQQDVFESFVYKKVYMEEKNEWTTKRIATFKSSMAGACPIWLGPLNDWVAEFEFDGFSESIPIERPNRPSAENRQQAFFADSPKTISSFDTIIDGIVGLVKDVIIDCMLLGILFSLLVYYLFA